MITKKLIFGIIITITIICIIFFFFIVEKPKNEIIVQVDNFLSVEKVKIEYGFHSINSASDNNIVTKPFGKVVFINNEQVNFETVCGENDFMIKYGNTYYIIVRHFIPNDFINGIAEPHKYIFSLKMNRNKIYLTLEIIGDYSEKIEREFVNVLDAKK